VFAFTLWWSSRNAQPLMRADHLRLILVGFLGYYASSFLDFMGLQYISAAFERLILYLTPTVVLFLSALFLRKAITRLDAVALGLSYSGIVLVFWHDVALAGRNVPLGAALVFGAAVCYATYLVICGEMVKRIGAIRLTSYAMCVASALCFAQFVLVHPLSMLAQPQAVIWLSIGNALLSTVLPVFATMLAVSRIGAGNVSLAGMIGPVSMIGFGYLFLDERVTGWQLAGTALVLAGVFVLTRKSLPATNAAATPNTAND
jgi:drug/metabolite transporter (DMT)-like permease